MDIICPHCKEPLRGLGVEYMGITSMRIYYYKCDNCLIQFERHKMYNCLGLMKNDNLYEIDKNKNISKGW